MRFVTIFLSVFLLAVMIGCNSNSQLAAEPNNEDPVNHKEADSNSNQNKDKSSSQANVENQSTSEDSSLVKGGIVPSKISIPTLNVEANVIKVGKLPNGQMASPKTKEDVGWYKLGAKPGEKGSAVLAAHVDSAEGPAVFFNLEDMKKGELIHVTNDKGEKLTFEVYETKSYPRDSAPLNKIFGYSAAKTLKLITCTGEFLDGVGTHENRLVVSAQLVEQS